MLDIVFQSYFADFPISAKEQVPPLRLRWRSGPVGMTFGCGMETSLRYDED
jgi:hypothetical protein